MTAPFDAAVIVHNSDPEDLDRPDWPQPLIDLLYRRKELRGKRHSSDPIRSEYSGRLDIWISRSQVLIDSHPGSGGSARVRGTIQQDPYPEVWNTLIELAKDRRIWKNTGAARWVFWFVEHQNGDQARLGCHRRPPAGVFPDFCLHLMRLVGLEGELQRFPPRRAPWL